MSSSSFNSFGKGGEIRSNSAVASTGLTSSSSSSSCRDSFVPIRKKPGSSSSSRRTTKLANLSSFSTTALLDKSPPLSSNSAVYEFQSNNQPPKTTINVTSPNSETNVNINDLGFVPVSTRNSNNNNSSSGFNSKSNNGFLSNNGSSVNTPIASTESSPRSSHFSLPDISLNRSSKTNNERDRKQNLLMKEDQEFIERLKQKVMDQQAEIEKSNGSLEQIQRNFEQLSSMYRTEKTKSETYRTDLERIKDENCSLKQTVITSVPKTVFNDLEDKFTNVFTSLKEVEALKVDLEEENSSLRTSVFELNSKIKSLINDLDSLRRDNETRSLDFLKQLNDSKIEIKNLQDKHATAQVDIEEKRLEIMKLEARLKDRERNLATLQQSMHKKESDSSEYKDRVYQLEGKQRELNDKIKEQNDVIEDQDGNIKQLEAKSKESIRTVNDLKNQISDLKNYVRDCENSEKKSKNQVTNLLDEIENYVGIVKKLEEELGVLKSSLNERKESTLEKQIKDLTLENIDLHKQVDQLANQKKRLESAMGEKDQLFQQLTKLQQENMDLNTKVQALSKRDHGDHLYSELMKAREENEESLQKLEGATTKLKDADLKNEEQSKKIIDLEEKLKNRDSTIGELTGTVQQREKELKEKEEAIASEIEKEKTIWRELNSTNSQLLSTISNLNADNSKLRQEIMDNKSLYENQILREQQMIENVNKNQKYLQATIEKLIKAEEATVSSLTCTHCFQLFEDPCLLVPCSHTYCSKCWNTIREESGYPCACPECSDTVKAVVRVGVLDGLTKKSSYRKEQLQSVFDGSAKYSERSAMTTISSRNTSRKTGAHTTSGGPLSSSPLDSKKSSSVYDEILKTAFKKKKPVPPSSASTSSTTTTNNTTATPSSSTSSTGIKSKTSLTPTKRNLDKTKPSTTGLKSSTSNIPPKTAPPPQTNVEVSKEHDTSIDQQQIPTRDTTEQPVLPTTTITSTTESTDVQIVSQQEPNLEQDETQEIPTRLEEEEGTADRQEEIEVVEEKPVIDISKISAMIESEKDLLNHTVVNQSKPSTVSSTPSERLASLTEEEKIKVKNLAARNLKYNNPEELFESPRKDEEDMMDNTIINNISVIETKEENKESQVKGETNDIVKEETNGESTPVFVSSETVQFPELLKVEETPIVKKDLDTSIESESSYGSYMESDDVVVFESPNKDEREVQLFSPIQKDDVMEPVEMNESFSNAATEKLESHLQKAEELEKENQMLELEIKHLEKELQSNQHNQEFEDIVQVIPLHKPTKHVEPETQESLPYFETASDEEVEEEEEPVQEEPKQRPPVSQPQIIEISREELIKPRAFMNHQLLFHEVKKELKRNVQEIKPIKIPEVFIREINKPKQQIIPSMYQQQEEMEPEIQVEREEVFIEEQEIEQEEEIEPEYTAPIVIQAETKVKATPQIVTKPAKPQEDGDEDLEFERELQKIVGEDFRRKKTNTILDSQSVIERGATSPIARLRRRVQSIEPKEIPIQQPIEPPKANPPEEIATVASPHSKRLAGYKARRDARMKLLEKQEIAITLLSNNTTSEQKSNAKEPISEPIQPSNPVPVKKQEPINETQQPRSRTASINSIEGLSASRPQTRQVQPIPTIEAPTKEKSSKVIKETSSEEPVPNVKDEKPSPTDVPTVVVQEVKTSRKKFDEVIIISPPRNPPPTVHHFEPQIQIDQELVEAIVPEDAEKVVLLKKTEALLSKSRERHSSPNRKIDLSRESESPNVSFVNTVNQNNSMNQSNNQSLNQSSNDPKQETLNRVNHLEKFMKDLKKKKQDELDGLEKKFDEMKSYFSLELGTRDSEINNLTNQNKLLKDKLSVAQAQIDDLSIVIEHILETQEVLEVQMKKKTKVVNRLTSPLIESREEEPVSPVSYPGNDVQSNIASPMLSNHPENNQPTPLAFSKDDINVDLSLDGEFYLSIGKSSLPLGEYVKTL